jgi:hypothetical protein
MRYNSIKGVVNMPIPMEEPLSKEFWEHAKQNMEHPENIVHKPKFTNDTAEDILYELKHGKLHMDAPGGIENCIKDLEKRVHDNQ